MNKIIYKGMSTGIEHFAGRVGILANAYSSNLEGHNVDRNFWPEKDRVLLAKLLTLSFITIHSYLFSYLRPIRTAMSLLKSQGIIGVLEISSLG